MDKIKKYSSYEGVESIERVIKNRKLVYEIILKPNYSFQSTGTQVQYVDEEEYIKEMLEEIIYCDGETIVLVKKS